LAESLRRFEPSWIEVGRVHRRVCFLRSEGRAEDASRVEGGELAAAVAEARKTSESEAEADALLEAVIAEDEERVADAIAFAEVLLPMLAEKLRPSSTAVARVAEGPRQRRPTAGRSGEAPDIADFIDDMLAQDRAGNR
jgi:hypothetical protein